MGQTGFDRKLRKYSRFELEISMVRFYFKVFRSSISIFRVLFRSEEKTSTSPNLEPFDPTERSTTRNYYYWLVSDKRWKRDRRKGIHSSGLYEPYARSMNIPFKVGEEVLAIMVGESLSKPSDLSETKRKKVSIESRFSTRSDIFITKPRFRQ